MIRPFDPNFSRPSFILIQDQLSMIKSKIAQTWDLLDLLMEISSRCYKITCVMIARLLILAFKYNLYHLWDDKLE